MENLLKILVEERQSLEHAKAALASTPSGTLRKKGEAYFLHFEGRYASLAKHPDFLKKLCRKKLIRSKIAASEKNIKVLKSALKKICKSAPEDLIGDFPSTYKGLPITAYYHPDALKWLEEEPKPSTFHEESLVFTTPNGVKMRSKSEWMIGTLLEKYGLLYRYEQEIVIDGVKISPDFAIMNPFTGEIFYWEHFGGLHLDGYGKRVESKLFLFQKAGYQAFKNFFFTFEADTKIPGKIEGLIIQIRNSQKCFRVIG